MLKYLPLGAAIATIVSTQIPLNIPTETSDRRIQVSQLTNVSPKEDNGGINKFLTAALVGGTAAGAILMTRANKSSDRHPTTTQIDKASPKLRKQLLTLLHNDKETANRLVAQIQRNNPNQSINWAAEKAIYDLERDRGGR